jgi:hypothetical protein
MNEKLESLDADLHGETKNNLEESHDDLCIQVSDVKKSKKKSKKHKKSELENSKPCLIDSTPDSHDHYTLHCDSCTSDGVQFVSSTIQISGSTSWFFLCLDFLCFFFCIVSSISPDNFISKTKMLNLKFV